PGDFMKRPRIRIDNRPPDSVLQNKVTLANMVEVCRGDRSDGTKGRAPAGEGQSIDRTSQEGRPAQEEYIRPCAGPATRCLNAYIKQDYSTCVAAGREALSLQIIPTVGLVTLLALRRQGCFLEAERFSRALLRCGIGPGGMLFILLMLLDGAL